MKRILLEIVKAHVILYKYYMDYLDATKETSEGVFHG